MTSISGSEPFLRLSYTDAVSLLQEEIKKDPKKWQFPDVEFGTDLATEHERWLAEKHFGKVRHPSETRSLRCARPA